MMVRGPLEDKKYLECGKIINTHGVRGAVKMESWCNSPEDLADLKRVFIKRNGQMECLKMVHASIFKQFVIAELQGVQTIEAAEAMKNMTLYAAREDFVLEEGDYFIADLIGLPVIDKETGHVYGKLVEVINRGASDIYVVNTENGERMMPAVEEFVKLVDLEKGIFVSLIEGMLD